MAATLPRANTACHANADDRREPARTTDVDLLALIRRAVSDAGWNQEALAAEMRLDKAYVSRVLSGEKPLSARFLIALPDDIEALVSQRYAEHFGFVVVTPVSGEAAVRHLVSGLFGVLAPQLPARASRMARASVPHVERKVGT